jgi:hypothetical protein
MNFSNDRIDLAPFKAINAREAAPTVSNKYSFIPTTKALAVLSDFGWYPTSASESRTRSAGLAGFQTHAVRLQNESMTKQLQVGSTIPQINMRNAHGGTSAFVLDLALLELRCLNGLMVDLGSREQLRVTHRGFDPSEFEQALRELTSNFSEVMTSVDRWRSLQVSQHQAKAFAEAAVELRWDGEKYAVDATDLLTPTRDSEVERSLWNVYNVTQEKLLKGGVDAQAKTEGARKRKARPVASIREDARLNKALWRLTQALEEQL